MARKTKTEAQATRDLILDQAERVFEAQGVGRTSLQEIAVAAGVTRGAIYWHFKDKAALFDAMMERVRLPCEQAVAELDQVTADDVQRALSGQAEWILQRLAQDEQTRRVFSIAMHRTELSAELGPVYERRAAMVQGFLVDISRHLQRAQALGVLPSGVDVTAAAWGYFALIDGLMHNWTLQPQAFDLVQVGRSAVGSYLRGVFTP